MRGDFGCKTKQVVRLTIFEALGRHVKIAFWKAEQVLIAFFPHLKQATSKLLCGLLVLAVGAVGWLAAGADGLYGAQVVRHGGRDVQVGECGLAAA